MTAPHTIRHAIRYLGRGIVTQGEAHLIDPGKPCAAFALAKRTLEQAGSIPDAIRVLTKQLEQS